MSWGKYSKVQNFFTSNQKEIKKVDKDGNEDIATVSYEIVYRTFLSNIVDKFAEETHKIKSKDCNCSLQYKSVNEILIKYKCLSCNKNFSNKKIKKLKNGLRIHLIFPKKEDFYSTLNMEDISRSYWNRKKWVWKIFEKENWVNIMTNLLTNVIENFRKMYLEIYEIYREKFISATELAWGAALEKN